MYKENECHIPLSDIQSNFMTIFVLQCAEILIEILPSFITPSILRQFRL